MAGGVGGQQQMALRHAETIRELYRPLRVNFPRRRTEIKSLTDVLQIDLADMTLLADKNNGYGWFLLAVNPFSKKFYAEPLKTKAAREVTNAMKKILNQSGLRYEKIVSDRGTEFRNQIFAREIEQAMGIEHFYTYSVKKAAIVERGIRTVKRKLYIGMAMRGTKEWLSDIEKVIDEINNTKIQRMGFKPNDVTANNERAIYQAFYSTPRAVGAAKFKVGDRVRKAEPLLQFRRSFFPGWSPHIYTITGVNRKTPNVYRLRDYYRTPEPGSFYAEELQKSKYPDYYIIERILERRGNRARVKWWGYNEISWIQNADLYINPNNDAFQRAPRRN